jgi:hypothetical protein
MEGEAIDKILDGSGMPQDDAEDAVRGLVEKGLVKVSSNKLEVISPTRFFTKIMDERRAKIRDVTNDIDEEGINVKEEQLHKKEFFIHQERDGKKRSVDIRPLIEKMEIKWRSEEESQWGLELVLRKVTGRTAKPEG